MTSATPSRRHFLSGSVTGAAALALGGGQAVAKGDSDTPFVYEVEHSEAQWKEMLTDQEFKVLRQGQTELPKSSDLWDETRNGTFCCRGCGLSVYEARNKVELEKGWAFFKHSVPNSVMTGIDGPQEEYGQMADSLITMIEAHCRRCGSHLGHILNVDGQILHCINGAALDFEAKSA